MSVLVKKNKLAVDITMGFLSIIVSFFWWYDFFENDKEWKWVGGVVFGLIAIIKFTDVVKDLRKNRRKAEKRTEL